MTKLYTGGCLCGSVRYEFCFDPTEMTYCHCDDCKKVTGSAFGVSIKVDLETLTIRSGHLKEYTKTADRGYNITRQFCPECGCPLFTKEETYPNLVWIKAGSLDEPASLKPNRQIWTKRAVPWAHIDDNLTSLSEEE